MFSAVALVVFLFALPWYGLKTPFGWTAATLGVPTSFTGWDALRHMRWLLLITPASAIALGYFQASRRAPAIPVTLSVVVTVLGALTALLLIYRVLLDVPGSGELHARVGAYLGLLSALGITYGGYASMRQEGISQQDAPTEIETVKLTSTADPEGLTRV